MRKFVRMAAGAPKKVVFPEGDDPRILKACSIITEERIARPILLGDPGGSSSSATRTSTCSKGPTRSSTRARTRPRRPTRRSCTAVASARESRAELSRLLMRERNHLGMMMVAERRVDGIVTGLNFSYSDTIRPALQIIGIRPGARRICGMYLMLHKGGMLFFGDTTVNLDYDATTLAERRRDDGPRRRARSA